MKPAQNILELFRTLSVTIYRQCVVLCRAVVFCVIPFPTVITLYLLQRHLYNKMADCSVTQVTKIVISQRTYNRCRSKEGIRFDNYCHVVLISLDVFINCNNYNVLGFTN